MPRPSLLLAILMTASLNAGCTKQEEKPNTVTSSHDDSQDLKVTDIVSVGLVGTESAQSSDDVLNENQSWMPDSSNRSVSRDMVISTSDQSMINDLESLTRWAHDGIRNALNREGVTDLQALVLVDSEMQYGQVRSILNSITSHENITGLTLVDDLELEDLYNPEHDFDVQLSRDTTLPELHLQLEHSKNSVTLSLGQTELGTGDSAFEMLELELFKVVTEIGPELVRELRVALFVEDSVRYGDVRRAIRSVTGRQGKDGVWKSHGNKVLLSGVGSLPLTISENP